MAGHTLFLLKVKASFSMQHKLIQGGSLAQICIVPSAKLHTDETIPKTCFGSKMTSL